MCFDIAAMSMVSVKNKHEKTKIIIICNSASQKDKLRYTCIQTYVLHVRHDTLEDRTESEIIHQKRMLSSISPHIPPSLDSERLRLADLEVEIAKRQAALQDRRIRLRDESASVLQLEASLIELSQENESTMRLQGTKEAQLEERFLAIARQEEEVLHNSLRIEEELRDASDKHTTTATSLDDRWREMEEASRMADDQHAVELARLRKQQAEVDEREAMLRDRQRELTHREQAIVSWQRRLQTKRGLLTDVSRNALARLVAELEEREAILQMD